MSAQAAPDAGPAGTHRLHGSFQVATDELRVTSQAAYAARNGFASPARICIRRWHRGHDGDWWPDSRNRGISIEAANAEAFGKAVAAAVEALTSEAKR
jgi:hypothetical protein